MPSVFRKKGRGGKPLPCYYYSFTNADGKRIVRKGYTDKALTVRLAEREEETARKEKHGLVERGESLRRKTVTSPVREVIERYGDHLRRKGGTTKHVNHIVSTLERVYKSARCETLASTEGERFQKALGAIKANRSARTANHARGALRGFYRWLVSIEVLPSVPSWIATATPYNERVDRKRVRRSLTDKEAENLLAAALEAPTIVSRRNGRSGEVAATLTGRDRWIAYLLALNTGFRANEIRTLTPEDFALSGESPYVIVRAAYSKHRRDDVQPLPRRVADSIREWIAVKPPGKPCLPLPMKAGEMLSEDMARAGISPQTREGVIDFHSLRVTFITNLSRRGVSPHIARELARHSTISLTIDTYTRVDDSEKRKAIEE